MYLVYLLFAMYKYWITFPEETPKIENVKQENITKNT